MADHHLTKKILKKQTESGIFGSELELNDKHYVCQHLKQACQDVTITTPRGTRKFIIPKVKGKIQSSMYKRIELMQIQKSMEENKSIPDFGYDQFLFEREEFQGWQTFSEMLANVNRYERINNYIEAKIDVQREQRLQERKNKKNKTNQNQVKTPVQTNTLTSQKFNAI